MRSMCAFVAVVLSVLMAAPRIQASPGPGQATAPAHIAGQTVLDAAIQEHARATDQDRETVRSFLERADVRAIAGKYGVDMRRAESAVAAMDASEVGKRCLAGAGGQRHPCRWSRERHHFDDRDHHWSARPDSVDRRIALAP
jgi:hypothetical protein